MSKRLIWFSFILILSLQACRFSRFVFFNFADIKEYKHLPKSEIAYCSDSTFCFNYDLKPNHTAITDREWWSKAEGKAESFEEFLSASKTVAFMVIKKDTVKYEFYDYGYTDSTAVASFSMAKSVVSILLGFAIQEGYIKSVDEPITNYLKELPANQGFEKITIKNLLNMESGIAFSEQYVSPFSDVAKYYYGSNFKRFIAHLKIEKEAGESFRYSSLDSQLLGMVVSNATSKHLSDYLQEKLWKPLGMEHPAVWSIDNKKDKIERAFCCLAACANDFAKLGRFMLKDGVWEGKQLLNEGWIYESVNPINRRYDDYNYQWWFYDSSSDFMAQGILGQYIYVCPDKETIVIRLGKKYGGVYWPKVLHYLANNI